MNTDIEDVDPFAEDPDSNPLPQEHDPTPDNAEDQGHDVPISDHLPDDDQPAVAAPTAGPTRRIRDIPLPDPIVVSPPSLSWLLLIMRSDAHADHV